jgi:hypothetical protein
MERLFIETKAFREKIDTFKQASLLIEIQKKILAEPESGDLIPGTGGIRKVRIADPRQSKGKSGGLRVLYLDLPARRRTYLLTLYGKGEKENISPGEKKILRELVCILKEDI